MNAGNTDATWQDFIEQTELENNPVIAKQNHEFNVAWQVGGATILTGAAYFEFFTWLMLGTAVVFVVVGYFYVPKTYIQDEGMVSAAAHIE